MKSMLTGLVLVLLAGCASTHETDVKYYNLSPTTIGASVFTENRNATGVNQSCIDRWVIDQKGNCVQVNHDSASGQGTLPAFVGGVAGSAAANTVTGAVVGAMTK